MHWLNPQVHASSLLAVNWLLEEMLNPPRPFLLLQMLCNRISPHFLVFWPKYNPKLWNTSFTLFLQWTLSRSICQRGLTMYKDKKMCEAYLCQFITVLSLYYWYESIKAHVFTIAGMCVPNPKRSHCVCVVSSMLLGSLSDPDRLPMVKMFHFRLPNNK